MRAISFASEASFIEANHAPIETLFDAVASDFPERFVTIDGRDYDSKDALRVTDDGQLLEPARRFLWVHTQGAQHGYDRGVLGKLLIPDDVGREKYMPLLADINYGSYNFVTGGEPKVATADRNIIIGGGFPHLNAGRLRSAIRGQYDQLHDVNSVTLATGQRLRWRDNANEATGSVVLSRTAEYSGLSSKELRDVKLLDWWKSTSRFAREHLALQDHEQFPTEFEEARLALELALTKSGDLFDWQDYAVVEHRDAAPEPLSWAGGVIAAREVAAYEYRTQEGRSFWVTNAPAEKRTAPDGTESEPRPNSQSAAHEGYKFAGGSWRTHENIIGTGAPHLRLGLDTAISLIQISVGDIAPFHMSASHWRDEGEPAITGIASIVSTYKADARVRALLAGDDPDSPELSGL